MDFERPPQLPPEEELKNVERSPGGVSIDQLTKLRIEKTRVVARDVITDFLK